MNGHVTNSKKRRDLIRQKNREGLSNVEIARILKINESTVRYYLKLPLSPQDQLVEKLTEKFRSEIYSVIKDHIDWSQVNGSYELKDVHFVYNDERNTVEVYSSAFVD